MSRSFFPEALADSDTFRSLADDERRILNQIRACSYLHLFDAFETSIDKVARERSRMDAEVRETLTPLLRLDCFDHHELFSTFESAFCEAFPAPPKLVPLPADFLRTLSLVTPLSLLILALHFKLVTQQHYLACVRGHESLEPNFVRLLKEHWTIECEKSRSSGASLAIQEQLAGALPGRIPAALRDYRLLIFACDDVLTEQAHLDAATFEAIRGALPAAEREALVTAQVDAHRKTFLTSGIVNAAFVYAMRALGPAAPAILAGIVSALSLRSNGQD